MDIKALATKSNFITSSAASKQAQQIPLSIKFRHSKMANSNQTLMLLLLLFTLLYSVESTTRIQVCGSKLSETIYAVCRGRFPSIQQHKRGSLDLFDYVEAQNEHNVDDDFDTMMGLLSRGRHSTLMATRRLTRGIVNECCLKSCSLDRMNEYCAY